MAFYYQLSSIFLISDLKIIILVPPFPLLEYFETGNLIYD
jgi:hypothetical protein